MNRISVVAAALFAMIAAPAPAATPPTFYIDNATADENVGQICFRVRKAGTRSSQASTVKFSTIGGTAQPLTDYAPQTFTIAMGSQDTTYNACVPLTQNADPEPTKTFTAKLTKGVNSRLGDGTAVGTITDVDKAGPVIPPTPPPPPVFTCQDVTIPEGQTGTVTCSKTGSNGAQSIVDVVIVGDATNSMPTASLGVDYVGQQARFTVPADAQGFTFQVVTLQDSDVEGSEVFGATVTSVQNATIGGLPQITIADDDATPVAGLFRIRVCPAPTIAGTAPEGAVAPVGMLVRKVENGAGWSVVRNEQTLDAPPTQMFAEYAVQPVDASGAATAQPGFYAFGDCLEPVAP